MCFQFRFDKACPDSLGVLLLLGLNRPAARHSEVLIDVRCPLPPEILGAPLLSSREAKDAKDAKISTKLKVFRCRGTAKGSRENGWGFGETDPH